MIDLEEAVPVARLAPFLDGRLGDGVAVPLEVSALGEGKSNLTFLLRRGDRELVLRRPPLGDLPETAHDMSREHRVLSGLAGTAVRAPRPVLFCDDPTVIGQPFYLMERVEGVVIRDRLPAAYDEGHRRRVGEELVTALAELHTTDVAAAGLADLGHPDGFTARQVRRWTRQWEQMATREIPDITAVRDWLAAHVPDAPAHTLVHGDYKLDNVVFSEGVPPRLEAILDWEMATLGDPLTDLGYLLVFWPEPGEDGLLGLPVPTQLPGFSTRAELVDRYVELTGLPTGHLDFYRTLALWKLAILSEGLYKRWLAGRSASDWPAVLAEGVPAMARRAREWCGA